MGAPCPAPGLDSVSVDLIIVGGGLAGGLLACRLAERRPELSVLVIEGGPQPGGNHTWSFHESDLDPAQAAWIDPFVVQRWPGHDVVFPGRTRRLAIGYRSVTSDRFATILRARLGDRLRCGAEVVELAPERVLLKGGEAIAARAVVDGRGPAASPSLDLAYQKFLGREVRLDAPHGLLQPILMDATVEQADGYRFVYVLPLDPERLLVEDTYYADGYDLDEAALRRRIDRYLAGRGWRVRDVLREEQGVLPLALAGDIEAFWRDGPPGIARIGLRAALFHPGTGYSLPDAVRLADHLAGFPDLSGAALFRATRAWSVAHWRSTAFFRLLNRLLFRAGEPQERFRVLARFYGLREPLIRRFYAGALSRHDKARLLIGKPPVPFFRAAAIALTPETSGR